jgi:hypothetical protein
MHLSVIFGLRQLAIPLIACCALVILAQFSYPTFHTLAEFYSVFIATMIFVVNWQTFR